MRIFVIHFNSKKVDYNFGGGGLPNHPLWRRWSIVIIGIHEWVGSDGRGGDGGGGCGESGDGGI